VPNGAEICRSPGRRERKEGREKVRDGPWTDSEIRRALAAAGGNKSQAAKLLGVDRKTLYNKLHHYGIE